MRTGDISISTENIFPIIKKWLYSDHDIFYRELISNGCDAITKLKKLDMMGEYSLPADYKAKIGEFTIQNLEKELAFVLVQSTPSVFSNAGFEVIPTTTSRSTGIESILEKYRK